MESQLNRAQLIEAIRALENSFSRPKEHFATLASIASAAGKLAATLPAFGDLFSRGDGAGQKSRLSSLLNTAVTGTSLWLLLRSLRHKS